MNILNLVLLQSAQPGGGSGMSTIIMIVAMIAIFYFFMIRPQQKQRKELKKQREAMTKGSKVVTAGGIHGTIRQIADNYMLIEVDKDVVLKVSKESVYPAVEAAPAKKAESKSEEKAEKE